MSLPGQLRAGRGGLNLCAPLQKGRLWSPQAPDSLMQEIPKHNTLLLITLNACLPEARPL